MGHPLSMVSQNHGFYSLLLVRPPLALFFRCCRICSPHQYLGLSEYTAKFDAVGATNFRCVCFCGKLQPDEAVNLAMLGTFAMPFWGDAGGPPDRESDSTWRCNVLGSEGW